MNEYIEHILSENENLLKLNKLLLQKNSEMKQINQDLRAQLEKERRKLFFQHRSENTNQNFFDYHLSNYMLIGKRNTPSL